MQTLVVFVIGAILLVFFNYNAHSCLELWVSTAQPFLITWYSGTLQHENGPAAKLEEPSTVE
eukprot:3829367-Amphidinium_carterae.1